jgi:hypothetical protein
MVDMSTKPKTTTETITQPPTVKLIENEQLLQKIVDELNNPENRSVADVTLKLSRLQPSISDEEINLIIKHRESKLRYSKDPEDQGRYYYENTTVEELKEALKPPKIDSDEVIALKDKISQLEAEKIKQEITPQKTTPEPISSWRQINKIDENISAEKLFDLSLQNGDMRKKAYNILLQQGEIPNWVFGLTETVKEGNNTIERIIFQEDFKEKTTFTSSLQTLYNKLNRASDNELQIGKITNSDRLQFKDYNWFKDLYEKALLEAEQSIEQREQEKTKSLLSQYPSINEELKRGKVIETRPTLGQRLSDRTRFVTQRASNIYGKTKNSLSTFRNIVQDKLPVIPKPQISLQSFSKKQEEGTFTTVNPMIPETIPSRGNESYLSRSKSLLSSIPPDESKKIGRPSGFGSIIQNIPSTFRNKKNIPGDIKTSDGTESVTIDDETPKESITTKISNTGKTLRNIFNDSFKRLQEYRRKKTDDEIIYKNSIDNDRKEIEALEKRKNTTPNLDEKSNLDNLIDELKIKIGKKQENLKRSEETARKLEEETIKSIKTRQEEEATDRQNLKDYKNKLSSNQSRINKLNKDLNNSNFDSVKNSIRSEIQNIVQENNKLYDQIKETELLLDVEKSKNLMKQNIDKNIFKNVIQDIISSMQKTYIINNVDDFIKELQKNNPITTDKFEINPQKWGDIDEGYIVKDRNNKEIINIIKVGDNEYKLEGKYPGVKYYLNQSLLDNPIEIAPESVLTKYNQEYKDLNSSELKNILLSNDNVIINPPEQQSQFPSYEELVKTPLSDEDLNKMIKSVVTQLKPITPDTQETDDDIKNTIDILVKKYPNIDNNILHKILKNYLGSQYDNQRVETIIQQYRDTSSTANNIIQTPINQTTRISSNTSTNTDTSSIESIENPNPPLGSVKSTETISSDTNNKEEESDNQIINNLMETYKGNIDEIKNDIYSDTSITPKDQDRILEKVESLRKVEGSKAAEAIQLASNKTKELKNLLENLTNDDDKQKINNYIEDLGQFSGIILASRKQDDINKLNEYISDIDNSLSENNTSVSPSDIKLQEKIEPDQEKIKNIEKEIEEQIDLGLQNSPNTVETEKRQIRTPPKNPNINSLDIVNNIRNLPSTTTTNTFGTTVPVEGYRDNATRISNKFANKSKETSENTLNTAKNLGQEVKSKIENIKSRKNSSTSVTRGGKTRKSTFKARRVNKQNERRRTPRRRKNGSNRSYKNSR